MSAIDIVILVIFAVGVITGMMKGAIRQIGSAAGVVVGFIAARLFGEQAGTMLFGAATAAAESSISPMMVKVMGCIVVYIAVWLAVFLVVRLIRGIVTAVGLGFIDRLGGAVVMVVKLFLAVSIVLNVWYVLKPDDALFTSSAIADGKAFKGIMDLFPWLMGLAGFN